MKNSLFIGIAILGLATLTGCPKQVNQSRGQDSGLGSSSNHWGTPNSRINTAGFNGSPSNEADPGPQNGATLPQPAGGPAK